MDKPIIKFNKPYVKIPMMTRGTRVIQVLRVLKMSLTQDFIKYDTEYHDGLGHNFAWLPDNVAADEYVLLIFLEVRGFKPLIWTTIRRATEENLVKYQNMVGKEVEIVEEVESNE